MGKKSQQFDIKVQIDGQEETAVEPDTSLAAAKKHAAQTAAALSEQFGVDAKVISVTPHAE